MGEPKLSQKLYKNLTNFPEYEYSERGHKPSQTSDKQLQGLPYRCKQYLTAQSLHPCSS